jgi:hypothetical protein
LAALQDVPIPPEILLLLRKEAIQSIININLRCIFRIFLRWLNSGKPVT